MVAIVFGLSALPCSLVWCWQSKGRSPQPGQYAARLPPRRSLSSASQGPLEFSDAVWIITRSIFSARITQITKHFVFFTILVSQLDINTLLGSHMCKEHCKRSKSSPSPLQRVCRTAQHWILSPDSRIWENPPQPGRCHSDSTGYWPRSSACRYTPALRNRGVS